MYIISVQMKEEGMYTNVDDVKGKKERKKKEKRAKHTKQYVSSRKFNIFPVDLLHCL